MAKDNKLLIFKGGALCAALCFVGHLIPILGVFTNYFVLMPIFYVGVCLGLKASLLAICIPMLFAGVLFGLVGQIIFGLTLFAPCIAILYLHLLKNESYIFSLKDILHRFTVVCLGFIAAGFFMIKISGADVHFLSITKQIMANLVKLKPSAVSVMVMLPGVFCFMWLLMIWLNFQIAYSFALKSNQTIRKPNSDDNIYLPPIWDIFLAGALWLTLSNDLFIHSDIYGYFSYAVMCICAFPLFIDGVEIIQMMAKYHRIPGIVMVIFMILIILLVGAMVFIVVLGLVEPLYGLKKKYLKN